VGRAGYCINHPGRPADIRCAQCGKALCADCGILDEGDHFCSRKCASRYRVTHRSYEADHARTPPATVVHRVLVVLVILIIVRLWVFVGAKFGWGIMESINDFLRRIHI